MTSLADPLRIGSITLKHRLIMAPLTRFRADDDHVPLPFVIDYYSQRASVPGTLIITEGTFISPRAAGYFNVPGIWNSDQMKQWRQITDAVHQKDSYIFLQLWAMGRAAQQDYLSAKGYDCSSSSDIPIDEEHAKPRPLTEDEIKTFIAEYATGAKNAIEAGFDGVEVHGANGYLIDQFFQDVSNNRTDTYGGSIENRARFGLEVTKAVVDAVGADKTGFRLSPYSTFQSMGMKDPKPQFSYIVSGLRKLNLAYLHLVESRISGSAEVEPTEKVDFLIDIWGGTSPVLIAGGFTPESAKRAVTDEYKDKDVGIVFGRYFIPNPDLPFRILNGIDLTPYDRSTFYKVKSPDGYIDWPFSKEFDGASKL